MECNFENCGYYVDEECTICGMGTDGEDTFCRFCKDNPKCYYKKLQELKAENERLKKEIKNNKSAYQVELGTYNMECGNLLEENKQLWQTLQEIKEIAEAPKPFIDFSETKTAIEVEYDYAAICNELELRLHKVLELITKTEEE